MTPKCNCPSREEYEAIRRALELLQSQQTVQDAVAFEREACAQLIENAKGCGYTGGGCCCSRCELASPAGLAAAIRARGVTPTPSAARTADSPAGASVER